jgi:hypothetical protein
MPLSSEGIEIKIEKLVYFLYKNEHGIFRPSEITIRKGLR